MDSLIAGRTQRLQFIPTLCFKMAANIFVIAGLVSSTAAAVAQVPNGTEDASYSGPTSEACKHVEPLPAAVQQYYIDTFIAANAGKPAPPSSPAILTQAALWQQKNELQDFGGNCHYEADNATLPPPTPQRVVFFGDSITELWRVLDPTFFKGDMIDRGIAGQTTSQMLIRFRQDVLDLHPQTVHILAGVNDIAGNTGPTTMKRLEENMMSMIEQAQAQHIRVVVGSLTPSSKFSFKPNIMPVSYIHEFNVWLKQYASEKHAEYIDYFSPLADKDQGLPSSLSVDGLHPKPAGYAIMDPLALKAIQGKR